ncbi:hypothetical protein HYN56_08730 [Flavobacterium crocinum]|uniref:Uncharacterized protein n=1 Tax=Flavobacterium crocinum TaxID=2183896 RepID=A0A2S1YJW7_9FLAO|nr:hypothetical protein [Flavobacterium crocinum]AWK04316.1 hypothetical protein HYN56_08730 [Flavobacterium crocinum]
MKNLFKIIILCLLFCYSSYAQQLVENTKDMSLLKENEFLFVNKPLKDLLKEIRPEIKTVFVIDRYFCFNFRTLDEFKKDEGSIDDSVMLFVYVKDFIEWKWENRPKNTETVWSKEDVEKYGGLQVARIEIINGKD